MKLFSISGATTLFYILAPVTAMSDVKYPGLLRVPNPNSYFEFLCPSFITYNKPTLMDKIQMIRRVAGNPQMRDYHPKAFDFHQFNIPGEQLYYPLSAAGAMQDYLVFNTDYVIAGVVTRSILANSEEDYAPCDIIV
ncbi:BgTH12-07860 [Blumeria graminis f. sp. triticale]|uniref:Bgt-50835 n=2 Tax=Blumeria graminis TaxID=34373 RepID=A0A9X9MKL9_BLUGR|nr:BgTH12-06052 [Blumeria graminis f. sp. triticale]CAD6504322.1 BgTH12-06053 [Blumeria graminis f. sp. triticale]CAD6506634.1 BgTH12-07860 [Blumeria graminis f. sp. triticale]VDB91137.1 Bgt-50835 [Blumeria graminis f. sp. tritici]